MIETFFCGLSARSVEMPGTLTSFALVPVFFLFFRVPLAASFSSADPGTSCLFS